jgi:hypothetical protein
LLWKHRALAGASLTVGVAVGLGGFVAGPALSSVALGICGAAASAAAFVLLPFTDLFSRLTRRRS